MINANTAASTSTRKPTRRQLDKARQILCRQNDLKTYIIEATDAFNQEKSKKLYNDDFYSARARTFELQKRLAAFEAEHNLTFSATTEARVWELSKHCLSFKN